MKALKVVNCVFIYIAVISTNLVLVEGQTKSKNPPTGYAQATYSGFTDNDFMKNWMVLGPVKLKGFGSNPSDSVQKEFFDKDELTKVMVRPQKVLPAFKIGDSTYNWQEAKYEDGIIDLNNKFGPHEYSIAYALAEIKMDKPAKVLMGIGSDDGIKIFLNGILVHQSWIGRPTTPDDDIVVFNLKKGSNQILLKVQNMRYGWSFALRKPGKDNIGKLLIESAGKGNLDNVKILSENGANLNFQDETGKTAYINALIRGRLIITEYLKEKGANTDIQIPAFDKLVDKLFSSVQTGSTPGAAILVSQDGKIIYEKGFGYADIGNKVKVTPDTKFRIGSITKQFTAASILKLQEEGKLSIHDKLSKYIPDFPRGNEVTIEHLLTHTSGIHSYTNRNSLYKYLYMPITSAALIDTIKAYPYDFNPGDLFSYNNSGFFILGYIVEKVSGKNLNDYLKESFFKPLGMNNTGIYSANTLLENEAYGYSTVNGILSKAINWNMSWAGGAGALYSTVRDLNIWNEAIFNGKVLSAASLHAAFTSEVLNNKLKTNYGFGWFLQNYRGYNLIFHGGGLDGFVSILLRQPDKKITIVELCNSTPPPAGIDPSANANLIMDYMLWENMSKQSSFHYDFPVDEKILKSYVGRYDYGQGLVMNISLEGKQLFGQLSGQSKYPIYPSSIDELNWKVVEAKVKFFPNEQGNTTHLIHYQGSQEINALKLKDETPVSVDPSIFKKFEGKYDIGKNYPVSIQKENDKLYIVIPNFTRFQLFPASETEYFGKEINIRVNFQQNAEGKTDSFKLYINNTEQLAKKLE